MSYLSAVGIKYPPLVDSASLVQPAFPHLLPTSPGLHQYADPVTDLLDHASVFRTRLFRESCVFHQGCYVKDLSRLGRDLHKTLILDNSPASYIFHPNNAVSFDLFPSDMKLLVLNAALTIVINNIDNNHWRDAAPALRPLPRHAHVGLKSNKLADLVLYILRNIQYSMCSPNFLLIRAATNDYFRHLIDLHMTRLHQHRWCLVVEYQWCSGRF